MAADELLRRLVQVFDSLGIPYALGGSLASVAYGEPRATLDIDVIAELGPEAATALKQGFPPPDFYLDVEAARTAIDRHEQFNIIHPASGFKADIFVAHDEVQRSQIARRRRLPALPDLIAPFSPPEELIIKKLQYYQAGGSEKHLRDVAAMLRISGEEIDRVLVSGIAERVDVIDLWKSIVNSTES